MIGDILLGHLSRNMIRSSCFVNYKLLVTTRFLVISQKGTKPFYFEDTLRLSIFLRIQILKRKRKKVSRTGQSLESQVSGNPITPGQRARTKHIDNRFQWTTKSSLTFRHDNKEIISISTFAHGLLNFIGFFG